LRILQGGDKTATSCAGVRIETTKQRKAWNTANVTPRVGVWI